jgi:hypothetical protein
MWIRQEKYTISGNYGFVQQTLKFTVQFFGEFERVIYKTRIESLNAGFKIMRKKNYQVRIDSQITAVNYFLKYQIMPEAVSKTYHTLY